MTENELVEQLAYSLQESDELLQGDYAFIGPLSAATFVRNLLPIIRSHTNALVAAAYGACAKESKWYMEQYIDGVFDEISPEDFEKKIRSLTPADAAQELERRDREVAALTELSANELLDLAWTKVLLPDATAIYRPQDLAQELERRLQEAERKGRLEEAKRQPHQDTYEGSCGVHMPRFCSTCRRIADLSQPKETP